MASISPPPAGGSFADYLAARGLGRRSVPGERSEAVKAEDLWRSGAVAAAELADAMAAFYRLPRLSFQDVAACPAAIGDLSSRFLRETAAFPFERQDEVWLAVADAGRDEAIAAIRLALGRAAPLAIVSFEDIDLLFERAAADTGAVVIADDEAAADAVDMSDSVETLQDLARGAPIVRIIDDLLERAVAQGATDIHLETGRDALRVRLRVDGHLRQDQAFARPMAPALSSRVKILSGLDIAERRLPQDGRANVRVGTQEADLRVANAPTLYGEAAVLRILLKDSRLLELTRIGMTDADQQRFRALLGEPHGMLVVTGPTGSGKTTTLATAVSMLNDPSRKIMTVEDPIEYQIPGVHQTQVKPAIGLDFAAALRSFLRHDPDIIMVGEMRDRPTAQIGIQAALTGHLVLTTLHTNTAADAIVRLVDMGVEPYLIASTLRGVLGQRLVRRLCERCSRPSEREAAIAGDVAAARGYALPPGAAFRGPVGCEACGHTGYRGRIGIFEVLAVDDALRALIRREPDQDRVVAAARQRGMTTMLEDGLAKSAAGLTSMEEVLRATG